MTHPEGSPPPVPIVIHRDEHFLALNKPAGLLVHRTALDAHETATCVGWIRDDLNVVAHPLHRLDKPTSGIVLFAFDKDALRWAQSEWEKGRVLKRYQALVRGWIAEIGTLDYPLPPAFHGNRASTVDQWKSAITHYCPIHRFELPYPDRHNVTARCSLVSLQPVTGRTHQLRRHCAHLRHPIIGDTRYGDGRWNRLFRETLACSRLMLQANGLSFQNGYAGAAPLDLTAEPPENWQALIEQIKPYAVD